MVTQPTEHTTATPLVSIVIPFLAGSPYIARCVDAVNSHAIAAVPSELVLVANACSSDEPLPVEGDQRTVVLRSRTNLGFGGGCNWAARHARGKYLALLNDDTEVEAGWLDALLAAIETNGDIAAAGSVVMGRDGRIQEAGRVLWREGVGDGLNHTQLLAEAAIPRLREVDYCSACALLVRRRAWDLVGGFDERYFPAYYEDVDISLEWHRRGLAVVCTAESRVRHDASSSTTVTWRRFLGLRNHRLFVDKWAAALSAYEARPGNQPSLGQVEDAVAGAGSRRLLVYHRFGMSGDDNGPLPVDAATRRPAVSGTGDAAQRIEQLETELSHLQAELRLKDEYITHLRATAPEMERALQHLLEQERRQARRRDFVRRIPWLGQTASALNRAARSRWNSDDRRR